MEGEKPVATTSSTSMDMDSEEESAGGIEEGERDGGEMATQLPTPVTQSQSPTPPSPEPSSSVPKQRRRVTKRRKVKRKVVGKDAKGFRGMHPLRLSPQAVPSTILMCLRLCWLSIPRVFVDSCACVCLFLCACVYVSLCCSGV